MKFGFLILICVYANLAQADNLVRVNINRVNPEGLCFARTESPKADSLCEFVDDTIQTSKAITSEERATLLADLDRLLPKPAEGKRKGTCRMPVEVTRADEMKLYCFEDLTSKQRLAFRAWFKKTRQRLAKK